MLGLSDGEKNKEKMVCKMPSLLCCGPAVVITQIRRYVFKNSSFPHTWPLFQALAGLLFTFMTSSVIWGPSQAHPSQVTASLGTQSIQLPSLPLIFFPGDECGILNSSRGKEHGNISLGRVPYKPPENSVLITYAF